MNVHLDNASMAARNIEIYMADIAQHLPTVEAEQYIEFCIDNLRTVIENLSTLKPPTPTQFFDMVMDTIENL